MSKEGKLRLDLIDPWFVEHAAKVCEFGEKKYGPDTWKTQDPKVFITAAERHLLQLKKGFTTDLESSEPHTAHIMVNMMYAEAVMRAQMANKVKREANK